MIFPVVMYGCESWAMKQAAREKHDSVKMQCWKGTLQLLWTFKLGFFREAKIAKLTEAIVFWRYAEKAVGKDELP